MTDKVTWPARDRLIEWLADDWMSPEYAETFCDMVVEMVLDAPIELAREKGVDISKFVWTPVTEKESK